MSGLMRRLLIALPITILLAVPAQAAAPKAGAWKATSIQRGYSMTFKVKRAKITNVVAKVLETCDGSSTSSQTTVGPGLTWSVKGGRFKKRIKESANGVTLYTTLEGRFTSATKATGTIRQESIVAGSTCDTFKLKFTAKRG
jgi:hypothetical protein